MSQGQVEVLIQIAERVPPGDRWRMVVGTDQKTVLPTLTDALERYATEAVTRCPFRLDPFQGKLYVIRQQDAPEPEVRKYSIYDED